MRDKELIKTETIGEFEINTYFFPEEIHPDDLFDYEALASDNQTAAEYREDLLNGIESGRYLWIIGQVTAWKNGIELASTSLGACLHDSADDFFDENGYYPDMVKEVINEAKNTIKKLAL